MSIVDSENEEFRKVEHFLEEFRNMKRENKILRAQLERTRASMHDLQYRLAQQFKSQPIHKSSIDLHRQLSKNRLEDELLSLQTQINKLQKQQQYDKRRYEQQLDECRERIKQLEKTNNRLIRAGIEQKQEDRNSSFQQEYKEARVQINSLLQDKHRLQAKLKQSTRDLSQQEIVIEKIKNKMVELEGCLQQLADENRGLSKQKGILEQIRQEDFALLKMLESEPGHLSQITAKKLFAIDCV